MAGQIVLNSPALLIRRQRRREAVIGALAMDGAWQVGQLTEAEFNEALCARTRCLRKERGWTAEQMATALGINVARYRKYEYRTPLPHYLFERFALIVGRDIEFLLTGRHPRRRLPDTGEA